MTGKANERTLDHMFAPYCATCGSRRLLPVSRIVASDWEGGGPIQLRCRCGSILDADASPPERHGLTAA